MKITIAVLLLAIVAQAASSRSKQRTEESKTEKRALLEGNAGIEKRAPVLPTALPSLTPGIEYADSKDVQAEKSPQQQLYATAIPQLAKISDVLTGQGPPFQAAITSHLFSPVSIYQPRLSSPTYEVSAPVPSQLAYTEKITYQPQTPKQFIPQAFKKTNFRFAQPVQQYQIPQQLTQQPQYITQPQFSHQPQIIPQTQSLQPQLIQIPQPYQQQALFFNPQLQYHQLPQQPLAQITQQPGIVYVGEEHRPAQKELKTAQTQTVQPLQNTQEKQVQNYNTHSPGAISFASFSVGPPVQNPAQYQQEQNQGPYHRDQNQQYQNEQYHQQNHAHNQAPQQFQPQIQQYQTQSAPLQPQFRQYQVQRQTSAQINPYHNQQYQPQTQIQIQPQVIQKLEPSSANSIFVEAKTPLRNFETPGKDEYRSSTEPLYQPQPYQTQGLVPPTNPYGNQAVAIPTYPPVQFFGKYAHTIFRQYQQ